MRAVSIGAADDPDGARLPLLQRLAEQKATRQQRLQVVFSAKKMAASGYHVCVSHYQIYRLALVVAQMAGQPFVFAGCQQVG